ncbi:EthD family reductase [Litchfieldia alkalitelluris]|uniref:EthD family reductase n=1 Tax=Litchfieldia alkalitelluris TaxID=304268 RepID=UPI001475A9A9|nr:EthD family reductase [Litchfieldia alkalitelluris]
MAKFMVLYEKPEDIEGFENYYFNTHMPLVQQLPNIIHASLTRVQRAQNTDLNLYLIVQLDFENIEMLHEALGSDAGQAVIEDAGQLTELYLHKPPIVTIGE